MKKRARPLKNVVELPASIAQIDPLDLHVAAHGDMVAAWLVWRFHAVIRYAGGFRLHLPAGATMPAWMRVGLEFLRRRRHKQGFAVKHRVFSSPDPSGQKDQKTLAEGEQQMAKWLVEEEHDLLGGRHFVVRWLDYERYSRRTRALRLIQGGAG